MDDKGMVFINGEYVAPADAKISVFDNGFIKSDVVYDVTSTWHGQFFRLDDHVARFLRSCEGFRLPCPYSADEIRRILAECVAQGDVADASYVELALTRGHYKEFLGAMPNLYDTDVTFIAYAIPYRWIVPPEQQATGIDIIIAKTRRIPNECVDARFKNFHWGDLTMARFEAIDAGAQNAILCTPDGVLSEGPGFNVFWTKDGTLHTPDSNVLEGITRQTVFDLADDASVPSETGRYPTEALLEADEAFLCSTAGGIMPVVGVDDRTLSNGAPGEITSRLRELYWSKREAGWLGTPVEDILQESAAAEVA